MSNQLQVILKEQQVAQENAKQLLEAFGAPFEEAGVILASYESIVVKDEEDFTTMAEAREKRLALKNVRTSVERKRKELKEDIVRSGRAIDSVARFVKETIEPAESYLETQEKFAEIKAEERAAKLKAERIEQLSKYTHDISLYNFEAMNDEQFTTLIKSLKAQEEAEIAAAKKAEEERLAAIEAEKKRQAEIEAENAKLRAEAEAREKQVAAERAKLQAEAEAEREKREALEAEQRAAFQKETAERVAKEAAERDALLAPDKEKLLSFATHIEELTLPALASKDAQAVLNNVEELLAKVTTYIRGNVKGL